MIFLWKECDQARTMTARWPSLETPLEPSYDCSLEIMRPSMDHDNIHQNRVSRSRSMLVIFTLLQSMKSNSIEGGRMGLSRSNTWSLVGRPEGLIGGMVLVNGPGCSVPVCRNHVGRTSRRHGCYSILNLRVKSLMEFHHYGLWIGVTGFPDKVLEFIKVFIHGATLLEISHGFQPVDGC